MISTVILILNAFGLKHESAINYKTGEEIVNVIGFNTILQTWVHRT